MVNERLRDTLLGHGITPAQLAERLDVDSKTVERWITRNRTPYPRHRYAVAALLHETESYLWPDASRPDAQADIARSEVIQIYPRRNTVPSDLWLDLLSKATERIEVLVYVGMFLTENPDFIRLLETKGSEGATIRLLFGDPTSREVVRRSADEGIGEGSHIRQNTQRVGYLPGTRRKPWGTDQMSRDDAVQLDLPIRQ